MDDFISQNNLKGTFAYLDDVTICGLTKEKHDENLGRFMKAAERYRMTLHKDKCVFFSTSIRLLGYEVRHKELRPDPDRLTSLQEMPLPRDKKELSRSIGLFAYYSKWIPKFSEKIRPLIDSTFPLKEIAQESFSSIKEDIVKAVKMRIDDKLVFTLETDASEAAIGATLSQEGRPVAFFSRTLNSAERKHCSVEKEAYAIVEAVKRWHHFLSGRHFQFSN